MTGAATSVGLARAGVLLEANRAEQALQELGRLPEDEAISAAAFELRAEALVRLQRWAEAADAARRGLAVGATPVLFGYLGVALSESGAYPEAEQALLDGLALAPHDAWLLCRYADLCLKVHQVDKAARLVDRAAEQAPHASMVYAIRINLAFARGDDRLAHRLSEEYLGVYPEEADAHALHGQSAGNRGRVATAYASLRQAVARNPADQVNARAAGDMREYAHPLLAPLRPMYRIGAVKMWIIALVVINGLGLLGAPGPAGLLAMVWLPYVMYSWVAPLIVRRLIGRRPR